jgi:PhnB protein
METIVASVSTYLNFQGNTAEAFEFYRSVFGTQFQPPGIQRMSSVPEAPGQPPMPEAAKNLVLHVALPILGGHVLHGTDAHESMGFSVQFGNNVHINLHPDTRAEADRLFNALSAGGQVDMPLQQMFWGDYFGSFTDKFGMKWMINTSSKE